MKQLLSVLLSVLTIHGYAQIGFGVEAGANFSDYNIKLAGADKKTEMKSGMRLGALCDLALTNNLYFQPGIYYVTNGYRANLAKGYEQYDLHTIEVPLNIQYTIGIGGTNHIFVGLGPYLAFNGGGYYTIQSKPIYSKRALRMGSGVTDDMRHYDFGGGINVGYQITEGLFARVRAQMGFVDLLPEAVSNSSAKSMGVSISAGYWLYRKYNRSRSATSESVDKNQKDN